MRSQRRDALSYTKVVYIFPRDRAVIGTVASFGQLTFKQINELHFYPLSSKTNCENALKRLRKDGLITRIPHRIVGGAKGGSGQYVYVLTTNGRRLAGLEGRSRSGHVNYHALAIVDLVIALKRLERAGIVSIEGMKLEPECHVTIAGHELKPDLYAELSRDGQRVRAWWEIDLGTEGQRRITEKIMRYYQAYAAADTGDWEYFPAILWVAVDDARAKELNWMLAQVPENARVLHRITTLDKVGSLFG
jgi:hypothetical protein